MIIAVLLAVRKCGNGVKTSRAEEAPILPLLVQHPEKFEIGGFCITPRNGAPGFNQASPSDDPFILETIQKKGAVYAFYLFHAQIAFYRHLKMNGLRNGMVSSYSAVQKY